MTLNKVLPDVEFADRKIKGRGRPDFCIHLRANNKLLAPIEIKRFNVLITHGLEIPYIYNYNPNIEEDNTILIMNLKRKMTTVIQQIYNYMVDSGKKYGVLSTYNEHWFIKRECGTLYISKAVKYDSTNPPVLKSYACLVKLAKEGADSPNPRIIETDSRYSLRNRTQS